MVERQDGYETSDQNIEWLIRHKLATDPEFTLDEATEAWDAWQEHTQPDYIEPEETVDLGLE